MAKDKYELLDAPAPAALEMAGAANYWTMAAMAQAKPVPMPSVTVQQYQAMQQRVRARMELEGVSPTLVAPKFGGMPAPTSTPARVTNLADMTAQPFMPALKMFMTFPSGGNFIGSAFIVGKRAVLTAGHCVFGHNDGGFASNIEYIPRFNNGSKPFGGFAAVKSTCLKEFADNNNLVFDIAASVVDKDFPAELGQAGYALNFLLPQGKLRSVGYPGQPRPGFNFDGNQMWTSVGDYHNEVDTGFGTNTARNWGHYNDMTGGCSGGPVFTEGGTPFVVGLNSHVLIDQQTGKPEQPPRMFSPYFGDAVVRLLKWLKENGGSPNEPGPTPQPPPHPTNLKAELQTKVNELSTLIARLAD